MIKAIQTRYAGCHFRSRLEARWAVAFDAENLCTWEYEPQGFDLDGHAYLPDFRLNWSQTDYSWAEIKPPSFQITNKDHAIFIAMAKETRGGLVLLGALDGGYRSYHSNGRWNDERKPFLIPSAITAGKSARFEHGQAGA